MSNKDVTKLLKELQAQGAVVTKANNGHWKIVNPATGGMCQITSSPRDGRTIKNAITRLRKIGLMKREVRA